MHLDLDVLRNPEQKMYVGFVRSKLLIGHCHREAKSSTVGMRNGPEVSAVDHGS